MVLVILIGGGLILSLNASGQVSPTDLQNKSGMVLSAECVKSRSVHGVNVLVNFSGTAVHDYFSLPVDTQCQEVMSGLIGNNLTISYFENVYFGVSVGDKMIRDTEGALSDFNDKTSSITFLCFTMLIAILALYFKGKHVTNKGSGRENTPLL
jgi:hypothetical protein